MRIEVLKSKIHRVGITQANLEYICCLICLQQMRKKGPNIFDHTKAHTKGDCVVSDFNNVA